jgi:hypothetical protein
MAPPFDFTDEMRVSLADPPQTEECGLDAMVAICVIEDVENPVRVALDPRFVLPPMFFPDYGLERRDHVVVFEVDGQRVGDGV